ncbi:uncharacterized protein GIQ15_04735 [Arthroderma uncinatum]|uniref:uncharacterized protein n=1 Tax=Arthroderma uncinatum TaxID=74035 RepID=UPI00144AC022|nr:uncharacterized protein GIQ15_04735 [Arthroderma uncinatum]KAF3481976.1 hypothetical protein GIQ15_04735 [Arthroderma uncinatum]
MNSYSVELAGLIPLEAPPENHLLLSLAGRAGQAGAVTRLLGTTGMNYEDADLLILEHYKDSFTMADLTAEEAQLVHDILHIEAQAVQK